MAHKQTREYDTFLWQTDDPAFFQQSLDRHAADGWRVLSVSAHGDGTLVVFEREAPTEPAPLMSF